jgi:hypothetical protein
VPSASSLALELHAANRTEMDVAQMRDDRIIAETPWAAGVAPVIEKPARAAGTIHS